MQNTTYDIETVKWLNNFVTKIQKLFTELVMHCRTNKADVQQVKCSTITGSCWLTIETFAAHLA